MNRLRGRVALITGASSGIGRGVALAFAGEGATVVVNYPNATEESNARQVEREANDKGGRASCVRADVSLEEEVEALVAAVVKEFGRIDILVNNAGVIAPSPVEKMSLEDWEQVLNVNLRGVFLCTKHVLPIMYAQDYGRIINTSSGLAVTGQPNYANYCASKAGILGFSKAVVLEIGVRNITVNCIAPGMTMTPMLQRALTREQISEVAALTPFGRVADVDDLVSAYIFFASDESSFFKGQCLSGGMLV